MHTIPPHLISAFQNRVSSVEENRRTLELMAAREQRKLDQAAEQSEKALSKEEEGTEAEEDQLDDNEEEEFDFMTANKPPKSAHGASQVVPSSSPYAHDDEETEYDFSSESTSVPSTSSSGPSVSLSSSSLTASSDSMYDVGDDDEVDPFLIGARAKSSNGRGKKRRRSITDLGDRDDNHDTNGSDSRHTPSLAQPDPSNTDVSIHSSTIDSDVEFDWMKPHTPPRSNPSLQRSSILDQAACTIVPTHKSPVVEMEYVLDSISGPKPPPNVKYQLADDIEAQY